MKTFKELNQWIEQLEEEEVVVVEASKEALKRALAISKWKRAGGKVDKQPDNIEKWWGQLSPEDQKRAANIAQYKKEKKQKKEEVEEGYKDLPPHLQKLVKKIEKRQKDWNKQNPKAKIKTLVYNPETGKPDIEVEEGFQEIQNLANLIQSETDRLVKAAKKGDMKTVMAIYRTIGNIIK